MNDSLVGGTRSAERELTVRIFVCSTFEGMRDERDTLFRDVLPAIRARVARWGIRIQLVDLRWGLGLDHETHQSVMEACLVEVARCRDAEPPGVFLLMVGDAYGWVPLPTRLSASEFGDLLAEIPTEERTLLHRWYRRDDNACPSEFELQPRSESRLREAPWEDVEERLRRALQSAADAVFATGDPRRRKFFESAVHQEMREAGAFERVPTANFVGCLRAPRAGACGRSDGDADPRAVDLQRRLREALPSSAILEYSQAESSEAVRRFASAVEERLVPVFEGLAIRLNATAEARHRAPRAVHLSHAAELARGTVGRERELQRLDALLAEGSGPVIVHGPSGIGKTSFLAALVARARQRSSLRVVARFAGLSRETRRIAELLESVRLELEELYGTRATRGTPPRAIEPQAVYHEAAERLASALSWADGSRPLLVVLDGLDEVAQPEGTRPLGPDPASPARHNRG